MAKDKILKPFVGIIAPENKFTVDTIDDLKSRNYLTINDIVDIKGFYTKGDRGAHKRIVEAEKKVGGIQLVNNLWANVMFDGAEVWVEWFGLNPESDNCSVYFNVASEFIFLYGEAKNAHGSRRKGDPCVKMKCFPEYYICKDTIILSNKREHDFNGATLDFNNSTVNIGVVCTGNYYGEYVKPYVSNVVAMKNVYIKGLTNNYDGYFNENVDFHKLNYLYKQGFTGLDCRGGTSLSEVTVRACERGINYSTRDTYLMTMHRCVVNFCKYGYCFDIDEAENSNENIKVLDCIAGNNWTAFLAHKTGAFFSNCSIDYNWYITEPNNPWETGHMGTPNGILSFDQCWFEDTPSKVETYFSIVGQARFSNSYFILPYKTQIFKSENPNDLITLNDCLFGQSTIVATDRTRLLMRGTTYHKLYSIAGAGKFRKVDNLVANGYMEFDVADEPITPDGNKIPFWDLEQKEGNTSGQTYSTLEYFVDTDGKKKLKCKAGKFRGCRVWTPHIPVRAGEFLTMKAVFDKEFCTVRFFSGNDQLIRSDYVTRLEGVSYYKLAQVPAGTAYVRVLFTEEYIDSSGTSEMVIEYCEMNVVS